MDVLTMMTLQPISALFYCKRELVKYYIFKVAFSSSEKFRIIHVASLAEKNVTSKESY